MSIPNEEYCPIPLEQLGSLLRGREEGIGSISKLPMMQRVEIALFCYRRAHLRNLAIRIAQTCDQATLRRVGGAPGEALLRAGAYAAGSIVTTKVTLAGPPPAVSDAPAA
jgi:hypothetical protein